MAKRRSWASVRSANKRAFAYTPPESIYGVVRVLLAPHGEIDPAVLAAVLRGFWRFTAATRILVTEHPALRDEMLGANMRRVNLSELPLREYPQPLSAVPVVEQNFLSEVDGVFMLSSLYSDETLPSLMAVAALTQGAATRESFLALRPYLKGAIVDAGEKIVWGDDLLAVEAAAFRLAGREAPAEIEMLQSLVDTADTDAP